MRLLPRATRRSADRARDDIRDAAVPVPRHVSAKIICTHGAGNQLERDRGAGLWHQHLPALRGTGTTRSETSVCDGQGPGYPPSKQEQSRKIEVQSRASKRDTLGNTRWVPAGEGVGGYQIGDELGLGTRGGRQHPPLHHGCRVHRSHEATYLDAPAFRGVRASAQAFHGSKERCHGTCWKLAVRTASHCL